MASNYIFTLTPTFTQGLILGQLSILLLLVLILKYLFLDSEPGRQNPTFHPTLAADKHDEAGRFNMQGTVESVIDEEGDSLEDDEEEREGESADWFNLLLRNVLDAYRSKLRDDLPGAEGDEVARRKLEEYANRIRPAALVDPIRIHSVDLGSSAPRFSNIRLKSSGMRSTAPSSRSRRRSAARELASQDSEPSEVELDMVYKDSVSVALSTGVLFNYPLPSFARLPVSLTISLELFQSPVVFLPPSASVKPSTLQISIPPDGFTLNIKTTSLIGSRAKLADVPKLHELIEHQIRRLVAQKNAYTFVLPGLASVNEVKEAIRHEKEAQHLPDS
ncbi:hypothetical protein PUNSTDRAFT_129178 [Punctularia strigosozonata HHB-11173 SS5]|uniref:uncharacterized protein n=1 Tax=Punctularia strigosozonata (strain HHB-11173) TaxID=741275 RepID=UPI0004416A06|nr:uncharacterized protein PUNSTDRAFT_129178 [Punctularia strigosozonata HHB-11173 SS5]EIN13499.1 hypothetical protein PUNSTDRAFT_129178 [Punctularia strigosozonata HHB-11173 SS5]